MSAKSLTKITTVDLVAFPSNVANDSCFLKFVKEVIWRMIAGLGTGNICFQKYINRKRIVFDVF